MVDSIKDLLQKKADKFDEDKSLIEQIQAILDEHFNGDVRALKITDDQMLVVTTPNAALASEVRLQQVHLQADIAKNMNSVEIKRLSVRIR